MFDIIRKEMKHNAQEEIIESARARIFYQTVKIY
jgi:hypothetical protein